ncbi:MAG TPA: serine/threonine-protein kinase [Hyalangium sp.]|nr:serine/threonine-protein kinase [Hyalangium sp.]
MGRQMPMHEVDPLALPWGTRVGPWCVVGFRGRGSYGTLYRVEREGREAKGPAALKLAVHPGDKRFKREGWLLRHIHSPFVPQFLDEGVWRHPSGLFPYVVMELVDGEPLYEWAARRNPSERQVMGLLTQLARAVADTHAAGGLHRDVKGSNALVRRWDGRGYLTDFGAGHYRGADTLTSKLLPPGTPVYRSPEAWGFLHVFRRHPTVHYPASTCDDLFALGMMAYRLVTDEYPPLTDPEERGAEIWRPDGPGPRPPSQLNPRVGRELDAFILRLLSIAPDERFGGRAEVAARILERAWKSAGPRADRPLFDWGTSPSPRSRSAGEVRQVEEQDGAAKQEVARRAVEEQPRAVAASVQARPRAWSPLWGEELAVALVGLLLALLTVVALYQGPEAGKLGSGSGGGDIVAVGDSASAAVSPALAPMRTDGAPSAVGRSMPEKPFPGQRTPPCNRVGEVVIRGGCWFLLGAARPPCKEEGKEDAYDWQGACYIPSYPHGRQPTSNPP